MIREAEAADKEKTSAAKKPAAKKKKRAAAKKKAAKVGASGRMKAIWIILDPAHKTVASFEYRDKAKAETKASDLQKAKGKPYLVRMDRVPMED